jgi:hypothetical protein
MKGLIISPRGLENAVDTLEEAIRFVIISSEGELGKDNFNEILTELKRNPSATYHYGGWTCKVDTKARRKGVGVIVRCLESEITAEFDSIHECALELGLKDQKIRSLINAANNVYDNKRFTKKPVW